MPFVNVILPDGTTYETPVIEEETTTNTITTVEHETVHQTDELEVSNVFDAVHDEKFDEADQYQADINARAKQNLNDLPNLKNGSSFVKLPHENDNDTTTDSSSISMYRTIYIEPPPNKPAGFPPPTLFTSGSICMVGEGSFAYIPYDQYGRPIDNTKYTFGRAEELGDRSHDNDGMLMQCQERYSAEGLFFTDVHKVHMSPNPTDPALVIYSNRRRHTSDYIRFYGVSPAIYEDENTAPVFRISSDGDIYSSQIDRLTQRMERIETSINTIVEYVNVLRRFTEDLNEFANINMENLQNDEWNIAAANI